MLYPGPDLERTARYVGSLNGLMGTLHDTLVQRRLAGTQDYYADPFTLPAEIGERLRLLADRLAAAR